MAGLRTLFAALTLSAAAVSPLSAARADTVRDPVMGFSIVFPGEPEPVLFGSEGANLAYRLVGWEQNDNRGFFKIEAMQPIPDNQVFENPERELPGLLQTCLGDATVVEERPVRIETGAGVEVLARTTYKSLVVLTLIRAVVRGNKGYCVSAGYLEGEDRGRARVFVRSFKPY